jgi:hypothetical protein
MAMLRAGPRRLLWFIGIYVAAIVGFTILVYGLRAIIPR